MTTTTTTTTNVLTRVADIIEPHIDGTFKRRQRAEGAAEDLATYGHLVGSTTRPPSGDARDMAAATLQARLNWPVAERIAAELAAAGLLKEG